MNIYLDTETTDLPENTKGDILTQLAYVIDKEGSFYYGNMYFTPPGYKDMSINAMVRTKLTPESLESLTKDKTPHMEQEFLDTLQGYLDNPDNTLYTHNTAFDIEVLKRKGLTVNCKVICTLRVMKFLNDQQGLPYESISLEWLHYYTRNYKYMIPVMLKMHIKLEEGFNFAHDALYDCVSLFMLHRWILKTFPDMSKDFMELITARPINLKYVPFGKNKGVPFTELGTNSLNYYYSLNDKDICYSIDFLR